MICVAISDKKPEKCISILDQVEMAEIRLDLTGYSTEDIRKVFSHSTPTIATYRPGKGETQVQLQKLTAAIEAGARYVDIEIEAGNNQQQEVISVARKHNCKVIVSYHNFSETPGLEELNAIVNDCYLRGADIAKIATFSHSVSDNARILSLYNCNKPLVAIGMGDAGKVTRIIAPLLGAEFTFASMDNLETTAPGQISYSHMTTILSYLQKELNQ
jgi:3-dehydroquinate dehydratase I